MFNDLSSPATLLATRRSGKPRTMVAPGPSPEQLDRILDAAIRVPDHGKLGPWRFVVVPTEKRGAFAEMLKAAAAKLDPATKGVSAEDIDLFAHQAPTLIVILSTPVQPSHIPLWEQELSAGAACMNLLNGAHAEGFVGCWLSTWAAYSADVVTAFGGKAGDRIAGFVYIGTAGRELEERPRPKREAVVSVWQG